MLLDMELEFSGFKHSDEYIGTHNTTDSEIGRGTFSDVYSTEILIADEKKKAAVKTLRQPLEGNEESYIQLAEVHNLRRFCHTNIVELYGISYKCDKEGTKYLQIFHGIKDGKVKIADMGVAKEVSYILGTLTGTPSTIAPEVYHGKLYGTEADIYSLGIIMWEMWYCDAAYSTKEYNFLNMNEFADCIKEGKRPTFNTGFAPPSDLKKMIETCWSSNTTVRPSAENVFVELSSWMRI
ncbi:unnamed protein product [Mytilus coruscus]|uniref:Protein kinase domain-containing protein n=1 Tax=Mytilus coruscus TaxID=42192 RepID=A0A6J8D1Y5_MYTCO|nr:unnamed protein product [Mytilus coruscus]